MYTMDQDVLTNGALGALLKQDQARKLNPRGLLQPGSSLLASPGFLVNCLSPKRNGNEDIGFPQLQIQSSQKRKGDWSSGPQKSPITPPSRKRTKYSLKEMADQFTASTIELAARSVMLPRAPQQKNSSSKLPGISESLNVFMSQNPEETVGSASVPAMTPEPAQEDLLSDLDMSWLEPTPIREETKGCSTSTVDPNPRIDILRQPQGNKEQKLPDPVPLNPQKVKHQFLSATPVQEPSLLHRTVGLFSKHYELVKGALDLAPEEVRRKAPLPKEEADACSNTCMSMTTPDSCGYPLNIALEHDANLEVLKLLADAAPEIITHRDGRDECGSLSLVLRRQNYNKNFLQIVHLLIKANPMSLRMTDRRQNSPLHIALASGGATLELVRVLCLLYPPALLKTNVSGETPLQVAQRTTLCQDNVQAFVQEAYNQELCRLSSSPSGN